MKRFCVVAILTGQLCASSGCLLMSDFRENMSRTARMFRPKSFDRPDDPMQEIDVEEESSRKTTSFEGRRGQEVQQDTDQWWRKHVMSPQAREIERNLGFE